MYKEKKICVVVPAYNEEKLIAKTVNTIPDFVDYILVVDDGSKDKTSEIVKSLIKSDKRILLKKHERNSGVGAALSTGYIWSRDNDIDITVVMNGDNQMDPGDLTNLIDPIADDTADYAKGNRLVTGEAWDIIPHIRYLGNSVLTFLTKIASGYWHVTDSQSGYTAINKKALHLLPLENIYPKYGAPNDILVRLNIYHMRVTDVPIRPVYEVGEKSDMKIHGVVWTISLLIIRSFFRRMVQKYIIRDFHPLIFFYMAGFLMILVDIPLIVRLIIRWLNFDKIPPINALAILFCTFVGIQFFLFAMLFDMEANKELKGK
ncbi:MAG: glycosyltransferase family 2 protein [Candidatus Latescibacteria bacterium]|nr:glycosyltransferase family 2 protein [Candidatus Latescibacterota bacterium]